MNYKIHNTYSLSKGFRVGGIKKLKILKIINLPMILHKERMNMLPELIELAKRKIFSVE